MDLVEFIFSDAGKSLGFLHLLLLYYEGSGFARSLLLYMCAETVGKFVLFGHFTPSSLFRGSLSIGTAGFLWLLTKWVLYCVYALVYLLIQILLVIGVIAVISFAYIHPEETRRLVSLSLSRLLQKLDRMATLQGFSSAINSARQISQHLQRTLHQLWQQMMHSLQTQQQRQRTHIPPPPAPEAARPVTGREEKCVICQDQPKSVLLLPCRHLCLCKDCKDFMFGQNATHQNCPLCRRSVHQTIETFI